MLARLDDTTAVPARSDASVEALKKIDEFARTGKVYTSGSTYKAGASYTAEFVALAREILCNDPTGYNIGGMARFEKQNRIAFDSWLDDAFKSPQTPSNLIWAINHLIPNQSEVDQVLRSAMGERPKGEKADIVIAADGLQARATVLTNLKALFAPGGAQ